MTCYTCELYKIFILNSRPTYGAYKDKAYNVICTAYEPHHEKTNCGFRTGSTQTELYKRRRWIEAGNFRFRKKSNCTICVAKTKALISFAVTAKLFRICGLMFSHDAAHIFSKLD